MARPKQSEVLFEEKRNKIVEAAAAIVLEQGLDSCKVGDVARACRISDGTIYLYFSSLQALRYAALYKLGPTYVEAHQLLFKRPV